MLTSPAALIAPMNRSMDCGETDLLVNCCAIEGDSDNCIVFFWPAWILYKRQCTMFASLSLVSSLSFI